ncbi:uncharacterized protein CBL_13242 [Carabus blaptoides fortunei]
MDISQLPEETKKRVDKERRKGEKKMEQFMKSIQDLSPEEKISALCKKNAEFLEDVRTYKSSVLVLQRKTKIIQKEKELLENEHSKSVLARSRLENLCRELQKQNKSIKDESLQKIREEEEKRKEVSARFQTSLNEVGQMMQQNTDKNLKLREDNIEISNKFQKLCDQFRQREEEVTRLTKQMSLEKQLAEATLKRIECQLNAEREIWNKEKEQHTEQLKYGAEERAKLEVNLKNLEEHLALYSKKYEEFETMLKNILHCNLFTMTERVVRPLLVCGPSGSGKSSLLQKLLKKYSDNFVFSVSHTTRKPRQGEENGVHYHFTDKVTMQKSIDKGEFIENAVFCGNMYGTSKDSVFKVLDSGKVCILDVDVQGAKQVKQTDLNPVMIFIRPPSVKELEKRLRARNTETEESLSARLNVAEQEIEYGLKPNNFHRIIINDDLDHAYEEFEAFILTNFKFVLDKKH